MTFIPNILEMLQQNFKDWQVHKKPFHIKYSSRSAHKHKVRRLILIDRLNGEANSYENLKMIFIDNQSQFGVFLRWNSCTQKVLKTIFSNTF